MLATEDDRGFQIEKRGLELEKFKEDLEEREKAVAKRAKEADDSAELLEREKVRKLGFGGVGVDGLLSAGRVSWLCK